MKKIRGILILLLIIGLAGCSKNADWKKDMQISISEKHDSTYALYLYVKNISDKTVSDLFIDVRFENLKPGDTFSCHINSEEDYENYTLTKVTYTLK